MLIKSEQDILDQSIRAQIISEIQGSENKARKDEFYRRYEVYKDRTYRHVVAKMLQMFDRTTVEEMAYAIANVSLCRKVIDKLARVYSQGVKRVVMNEDGKENEELTKQVEELSKLMCMNTKMKKTNRAYKRDKNTMVYVKPYKCLEDGVEYFDVEISALFPYLYDVIENPEQREKPLCVILSHYAPPSIQATNPIQNEQQAGIHSSLMKGMPVGNGKDEKIADTPQDQNAQNNQFIWWSEGYHFTTNEKGEYVSDVADLENPIKALPFVNFAEDQDGAFWAQGGEDLINGTILINSLMSHMNHIAVVQGYGQFYMTGNNLPKGIKIGPSKGIAIEFTKEDPTPQLGFLNASPPLNELKNNIDMYVALLLTTNNLSVSGVATQLGNSTTPAAGISLIIDKSESMEDVQDQQQIFHENEPEVWERIVKWINYFKGKKLLAPRLQEFVLPEDVEVHLKFPEPRPIMTEQEKLTNLKLRDELGLNTKAELLMLDDPQLTNEQALEKLKSLTEEKAKALATMVSNAQGMGANNDGQGDPSNQGPGDTKKNDNGIGAGPNGNTQVGPGTGKE